VYDEDDKNNASNDDFIGAVTTTVGRLTGAKCQTSILNLENNTNKAPGSIIIRIEPCNESN